MRLKLILNGERRKVFFKERAHAKNFHLRNKAQSALHWAISTQKIKVSSICEVCSQDKNVESHHEDYSEFYNIIRLCHPCHIKRHQFLWLIENWKKEKKIIWTDSLPGIDLAVPRHFV